MAITITKIKICVSQQPEFVLTLYTKYCFNNDEKKMCVTDAVWIILNKNIEGLLLFLRNLVGILFSFYHQLLKYSFIFLDHLLLQSNVNVLLLFFFVL